MKVVLLYALAWIGLVILAILNGVARASVYGRYMGEQAAHQVSTFTGIGLFTAYMWVMTGIVSIQSSRQAWIIGIMWLAMTVAFEFLFGHYVAGHSWKRLWEDYNLLKGRLWVLVLIWTAIGPYLFYKARSR